MLTITYSVIIVILSGLITILILYLSHEDRTEDKPGRDIIKSIFRDRACVAIILGIPTLTLALLSFINTQEQSEWPKWMTRVKISAIKRGGDIWIFLKKDEHQPDPCNNEIIIYPVIFDRNECKIIAFDELYEKKVFTKHDDIRFEENQYRLFAELETIMNISQIKGYGDKNRFTVQALKIILIYNKSVFFGPQEADTSIYLSAWWD